MNLQAENLFMPNSIRVHSGKYLNLLEIDPDTILIEDIAHGQSRQCRFGGHTQSFYSVAQHAVWCSLQTDVIEEAFEALMHDSTEAFIVDIPTPLKKLLPEYYTIESKLMRAICDKWKIKFPMSEKVKKIDEEALHYEWNNGMITDNLKMVSWNSEEAKKRFLERFYELQKQREDGTI